MSRSTIRSIVKRGDERDGDVHDGPRSGGPTKITEAKRKKVQAVVNENPQLPLLEITSRANVGLGHSTVDKIISESKFHLGVPQKSRFGMGGRRRSVRTFHFAGDVGQNQPGERLFSLMSAPLNTTLFQPERRSASGRVKSWRKGT